MDEVRTEIDSQQVEDFVDSPDASLYVKLSVKDYGDIVVRLRPEAAPITVANFQALVAQGYFNGTTFHRVYPGFMIQGGEGQDAIHPIKGEFAENGVKNPLLHIRGVLSMARTTEYDSATSQFFLMHADNSSLDGGYAAFGYVVAGMDTVDLICKVGRKEDPYSGERTVPLEDVVIECADFVQPA
ncbi:MAG: peptidylprolyl isomerase [Oscillospiraceae bacterium]|nr:peptidylprolyl isomerase [Oscillospiraceae bacterium]